MHPFQKSKYTPICLIRKVKAGPKHLAVSVLQRDRWRVVEIVIGSDENERKNAIRLDPDALADFIASLETAQRELSAPLPPKDRE